MALLEKVKEIVKEKKQEKLSPMDQLMRDPEVKEAARVLAKNFSLAQAREKLNDLLEEEGRLPKTKGGKTVRITYQRFKELLPKPRKKRKNRTEEE
jgi:hypothetical protein